VSSIGRVSVVLPAFNAARYIGAAIGSVLAQTAQPHEIIVVDDGSLDDTFERASSFPNVKVLKKEHRGIACSRNTGVAAAIGDLIAFLDADDLWLPDKLERQLSDLDRAEAGAGGTFGWLRAFVSPDIPQAERARFLVDPAPVPGYHASTLLASKAAFLSVGPFNEELAAGEFIDWTARARDGGLRLAMTEGVVALRRVHGNNTVLSHRAALASSYLEIVRSRLGRDKEPK
jgi:glycosyltransferase involved in cell wall biosynthesis